MATWNGQVSASADDAKETAAGPGNVSTDASTIRTNAAVDAAQPKPQADPALEHRLAQLQSVLTERLPLWMWRARQLNHGYQVTVHIKPGGELAVQLPPEIVSVK